MDFIGKPSFEIGDLFSPNHLGAAGQDDAACLQGGMDLHGYELPPGSVFGIGWNPLVEETLKKLREAGYEGPILQVKQLFGALQIYIIAAPDSPYYKIVSEAQAEAGKICEECGKPGKLRSLKGLKVECEECHTERKAKQ